MASRADGTFVPGSIIDGSGFSPDNAQGQAWLQLIGTLRYSGNPEVPDAAVVTVLDDPSNSSAPASYPVTVDGLRITGGAQSDFPTNVNEVTGGFKTPYGADGALVTQGGGIYVHSHVANLQVTDNVIEGNGGSYGGGVRVARRTGPTTSTPGSRWPATRSGTTAGRTSPAASGSSPAARATP